MTFKAQWFSIVYKQYVVVLVGEYATYQGRGDTPAIARIRAIEAYSQRKPLVSTMSSQQVAYQLATTRTPAAWKQHDADKKHVDPLAGHWGYG